MNIEELLNTTPGKALVKSYHAEQQQKRTDLFTELDTIKGQRNTELQTLNIALTKTQTDCDKAQRVLELAQATKHTATAKLQQAKTLYSSQVTRIEKELAAGAPESIDIFCAELIEEKRELQNTGITRTGKLSNSKSMNLRLEAIRETISKAQALKLQAVTDIEDKLQALRAGLPAIVMQ